MASDPNKLSFWYMLFHTFFLRVSEVEYAENSKDDELSEWTEDAVKDFEVLACPNCDVDLPTSRDIVRLPGGGFHVKSKAFCPSCNREVSSEKRFMRGTLWLRDTETGCWYTFEMCHPLIQFWHYLPLLLRSCRWWK